MIYKFECKNTEPHVWTVGFTHVCGMWIPDSDHRTKREAEQRAEFLNGRYPDAMSVGRHIARKIFAERSNESEIRLNETELAAICTLVAQVAATGV